MKTKRPVHGRKENTLPTFALPALLVLIALVLGLFMPSIVARIQDRRIDRESVSFSAGSLNLKLIDNDSVVSKLGVVLDYGEWLELKNGKYMSRTQAEQTLPAMLDILKHAGMNYAPTEYFRCMAAAPILLVSAGDEADTYIVWTINAEAHYGDMCYVLDYGIDDETGTVLGMEMYWYSEKEEEETGETEPEETAEMSASERATRGMAATKAIANVLPDCLPLTGVSYTAQSTILENCFYIAIESGGEYIYSMPVYVYDDAWSINMEK